MTVHSQQEYFEGEDWCICQACGNLIKNYRMETLSPAQLEKFRESFKDKYPEYSDEVDKEEIHPVGGPYCMDVIACSSRNEWLMRRDLSPERL